MNNSFRINKSNDSFWIIGILWALIIFTINKGIVNHQLSFFAGQIESLSSNKLGRERVIVDKILRQGWTHCLYQTGQWHRDHLLIRQAA